MKKLFILALLCSLASSLKAQYAVEVETWAIDPSKDVWVYTGSLPATSSGNFQKLKIEVFGGQYVGSTGETIYYITNRDVLVINQTRMGGTNAGQFTLRAFSANGGGLDFYIYTPGNTFAAYSVRATLVGGTNNAFNLTGNGSSQQLVQSTVQAIPPPGLPSTGIEQNLTTVINPVMISDAVGNIGINTFNPDPNYKLAVNGQIRSKEIKVEAGWSDYVFDQDYALKSLKEVEKYINQNKHLPDVPSASDVKKNGVRVGETEALLLKKIEELTLYLIEKDKMINKQQGQIDHLNQQMEAMLKKIK